MRVDILGIIIEDEDIKMAYNKDFLKTLTREDFRKLKARCKKLIDSMKRTDEK